MVENRPWLTVLTHVILVVGMLVIAFPIYVTFVASTHTLEAITSAFPYLPGGTWLKTIPGHFRWGRGM